MVPGKRKEQILSEATRLFSHYGFDRVTIKKLADACGITEPALYRHFPSKEAIYDAVLDSLVSRLDHQILLDRLEGVSDLDCLLTEMGHHILKFFKAHRELYPLLLYSSLRGHKKAKMVYRAIRLPYVQFLERQFDRLRDEGKIGEVHHMLTARCFVGMVFDCAMCSTIWKSFQGKDFKPENIITNNVKIFAGGLSSKGGI